MHVEFYVEPSALMQAVAGAGSSATQMVSPELILNILGAADRELELHGQLLQQAQGRIPDFKVVDEMDDVGWKRFLDGHFGSSEWSRWFGNNSGNRYNVVVCPHAPRASVGFRPAPPVARPHAPPPVAARRPPRFPADQAGAPGAMPDWQGFLISGVVCSLLFWPVFKHARHLWADAPNWPAGSGASGWAFIVSAFAFILGMGPFMFVAGVFGACKAGVRKFRKRKT